jgi:hypothetical protein
MRFSLGRYAFLVVVLRCSKPYLPNTGMIPR